MSIVLDLLLVAILGYSVYRGYKNGIIVGVIGVLVIVLAIYLANLLGNVYSDEFTGLFKPFIGGMVDDAFSVVVSDARDEITETPVVELTDSEKTDVYAVAHATVRQLGISDPAAVKIANKVKATNDAVGQSLSDSLSSELSSTFAYLVIFIVGFTLIVIIFLAIGNVLNLTFTLPELEKINGGVGAAIGFFRGLVIVLLLACIFRYLGIILTDKKISSTILLSWLVRHNFIAGILGI